MAEFIAIFYAEWFLKTSLVGEAPVVDIKSLWEMINYKKFIEKTNKEAERVLDAIQDIIKSMKKHSWYLEEALVPLCLTSKDINTQEKQEVTEKLFGTPKPR